MPRTFIYRVSKVRRSLYDCRAIVKGTAYLLSFLLSGCATFQGPGEFTAPLETPPQVVEDFSLEWPVRRFRVTQTFRPDGNPSHQGLDLAGPRSTPIFAAHDGRIIYAGSRFRGYGRMIIVEMNNTWATLYGHLNEIKIRQGAYVKAGDLIGTMGRSGRASGVHLHFEVLKNKVPVDPLELLGGKDPHLAKQ